MKTLSKNLVNISSFHAFRFSYLHPFDVPFPEGHTSGQKKTAKHQSLVGILRSTS